MGAKGKPKGVRYDDILLKKSHVKYIVETISDLDRYSPEAAAAIRDRIKDCGVSK